MKYKGCYLSTPLKKSALACFIAAMVSGGIHTPVMAAGETCTPLSAESVDCSGSNFKNEDAQTYLNPWKEASLSSLTFISAPAPYVLTSDILRIKSAADGIYLEDSSATLTGKTIIETTGDGAGIYLSERKVSDITLGDNLEVYTKEGMGIGAEITSYGEDSGQNIVVVGKNAIIRTEGEGNNGDWQRRSWGQATGYGVYSGAYFWIRNSRAFDFFTYSARVMLGHNDSVETLGDNAHAVYANKTGLIEAGDITVVTHGKGASGLVAEDGAKRQQLAGSPVTPVTPLAAPLDDWSTEPLSTSDQTVDFDSGRLYLTRDVNVQVNGEESYAFYSTGNKAYIGSGYIDGPISEGVYTVKGDMLATRKGTIDLRMIQGSTFTGMADSTQIAANGELNTTDNGYIYLDMRGNTSLWDMTHSSVVTQMDLNDARLTYRAPVSEATFQPAYLTVVENYSGNNGLLTLNTVLGGDDSLTDKLLVLGDVEAGNTRVNINNIGGKGALTQDGIEIVNVGGESIGSFSKAGRIVAGAYDYDVVRKGENWYLMSAVTPVPPPPPEEPGPGVDPGPGPDPTPGIDSNPGPDPVPTPLVRPEPGAYLANHAAANGLFVMRLHDRLGETQYTDALTGEKKVTSLWLRQVGGHNVYHSAGQLTTQSNRYVAQLGGDVAQWSSDGKDRWHLGIMGGYANNQSNTRSRWSDYKADGTVSGYSAGIYGTWYADNENKEGLYTDSWLIYSWFNNKVKGDELASESYKSRGVTASIEAGWTELMGQFYGSHGSPNTWYLQPKAQAIWMWVRSDDHRESNGSRVSFSGDGNVQTRLGLRAYINGHHKMDEGKRREFEPFVEVNWLHNTKTFSTTLDDRTISQEGTRNIGEIKTGVEAKLGDRLNMWGNVAVQMGGNGYHDASAMYGIKYHF